VIADQHGQPLVGTGCDRARRVGVGLDLTVDTALDEPDAAVGDRVCATAAGECSLRAAIDEANVEPSPDHITLASDAPLTRAGAGEDANATGDLDVHGPVTLAGAGHVIDAAGLDRALDLTTGSVLLEDLTVRNGSVVGLVGLNATAGGGVRAAAATTLVVRRSTVEANRAQIGGGVHTQGRLTIERATLVGNETVGSGSGGGGGAGVMALGPDVVIETSTISGNTADNSGSAVWYYGVGSLTIRRSTLEANRGGGTVHANRLTIGATVIRPGFGTACAASIIGSEPIVSAGYNVISDDSCGPPAVGDLIAKPYLEPLAANGGPTATHLPRAGSPALDRVPAGSVLCQPGLDQRGVARGGADACDAGAVEGVGGPIPTPLTVVVDTAADADDIAPGDGTCADGLGRCPLRAAVTETDRWPTDDSITIGTDVDPTLSIFDPPLDFNQHENRNRSGDLDIGDTVTILETPTARPSCRRGGSGHRPRQRQPPPRRDHPHRRRRRSVQDRQRSGELERGRLARGRAVDGNLRHLRSRCDGRRGVAPAHHRAGQRPSAGRAPTAGAGAGRRR
jgi:CSLREA domain-containing protein